MTRVLFYILTLIIFSSPCIGQQSNSPAPNQPQFNASLRKVEIEDMIDKVIDQKLKSMVEREVTSNVNDRFNQLNWILALLGIVGVGSLGTLANYFIEKAVEQRLDKRTGNITEGLEFSRFYLLTLKLQIGQGFTQVDIDPIMNYLRKVERNSQIRHSPDFISGLYQVMSSFTSASQSASIDELFVAYEQEILSAPTLVQPLLHHYGQEIISRDITPTNDVAYKAFEKLERVATSSQVPELALAYRTLYEFGQNLSNTPTIVRKLITSSSKLNTKDRGLYIYNILMRSKVDNWITQPTREGYSIQNLIREFILAYKDVFHEVYGMDEQLALEISKEGVSLERSEKLSSELAESVG